MQGEDKKMELWVIGQSDVYSLQAKNKMMKEDFATELRKVMKGIEKESFGCQVALVHWEICDKE